MAVVDGDNEGGIDGAECCSVKLLGNFVFGNVLAEDAVCLVWVGARWKLLSGGARPQWDVPHTIGPILQAGNSDLVVIQYFHVIFGEDGDTVVIAELTHGYE